MFVPEVAREYLVDIGLGYTSDDVRQIGLLQHNMDVSKSMEAQNVVCDTDLLTILVWQWDKYGQYDDDLFTSWQTSWVDTFFLCAPDIPWEQDALRENPIDRWRLYDIYKTHLLSSKKQFIELKGTTDDRKTSINNYMQSRSLSDM